MKIIYLLPFKIDIFCCKIAGKGEIKLGDDEKIYPVCLFSVQNKRLELFFSFFQNKANNWSSIIVQSYFEQFDVISVSLKETKGKVRGKGKAALISCASHWSRGVKHPVFIMWLNNSRKIIPSDQWDPFLLLFHSYLPLSPQIIK